MKYLCSLLFLTTVIWTTPVSCTTNTLQPGWENLGSRNVNYGLDRDEIPVTRRDGKFSKIRLEVDRGSINMHECIVVFGDGTRQNVTLKKSFHKGSSTRIIDLKGGRRVIRKVIFTYDTKNYAGKKARIKLLGLR